MNLLQIADGDTQLDSITNLFVSRDVAGILDVALPFAPNKLGEATPCPLRIRIFHQHGVNEVAGFRQRLPR